MTDEEKMEKVEKHMKEMSEVLNKKLDEQVKNGQITEHEARDHYFHMMMITMMVLK